jgi:hypothetical protein
MHVSATVWDHSVRCEVLAVVNKFSLLLGYYAMHFADRCLSTKLYESQKTVILTSGINLMLLFSCVIMTRVLYFLERKVPVNRLWCAERGKNEDTLIFLTKTSTEEYYCHLGCDTTCSSRYLPIPHVLVDIYQCTEEFLLPSSAQKRTLLH